MRRRAGGSERPAGASCRLLTALAVAGSLVACRVEPGATAPSGRAQEVQAGPAVASEAAPVVVADRGVVYRSDEVRVAASWRADVDPRGTVVVFSGAPSEAVVVANHVLDAGFNVALVESASRPLARQIEVAAALANDRSLSQRQRLEQGRQRRPALTLFWLDDRPDGGALAVLRADPPFRVQAAVILTRDGAPRRHTLASESTGELRVLAVPAPLDEAAWTEILRFIDEVAPGLDHDAPAT